METKLIFSKIPAIMADIEHIGKDRKNQSQGYNFRGIDDMYNSLHSHFAKHKVFYTSTVIEQRREERASKNGGTMFYVILTVKFTFYAEDGSCVDSVTVGEAMDSGDKASNKAMSTALKYALMQLLLIPTVEEKDTEITSPEVKPKQPSKSEKVEQAKKVATVNQELEVLMDTIDGIDTMYALTKFFNKYQKEWGTNEDFTKALTQAKERILVTEPKLDKGQASTLLLAVGHSVFTKEEKEDLAKKVSSMTISQFQPKLDWLNRTREERLKVQPDKAA